MELARIFAESFGRELAKQLYETLVAVALVRLLVRFLNRRREPETARSVSALAGGVSGSNS